MTSIVFPSSHWGSNIGNAFFHLGNAYLLEKAISNAEIIPFDLRSEKAFMPTKKQFQYDSRYYLNIEGADYVLLDGPLFDKNFGYLFEDLLKRAKESNTKVLLMSTGGINYDKEELKHCKEVLERYPPFILTTRDRETYKEYSDYAEHSYDGLCGAWFCKDYFKGMDTPRLNKYIALCFDNAIEPMVDMDQCDLSNEESWIKVNIGKVEHRQIDKILRLLKRGGYPTAISGYDVIRPSHQVLHRANWRLYFKENSFFSQTPWGYLNIYRNSSLTITDRLHAAVATLSYGNPARLIIKSKRANLLSRVNASDICNKISKIDMSYLQNEKDNYLLWLKNVFAQK